MNVHMTKHGSRHWFETLFRSLLVIPILTVPCNAGEVKAVPVGVVPYAMCATDMNGDGRLDLVVGGIDQDAICAVTTSGEHIWRYETEGMPLAVEAADIDGDEKHEIVAIIGTPASKIVVLDRAGRLGLEISPEVIVYLLSLGDIDDDGRADIVVAGYMGKLLAFNFRGDQILDETVASKNFVRQMAGLATGDIDGDGRTDIAYHSSLQLPGILDADDNPMRRFMLPSLGGGLLDSADINGDGKAELLYGSLGQIRAESRTRKLWSIDLKQKASELGAESPGERKFPWEYGGTRSLVAGDFAPDEGLEIASFASDGKFNLLSASGKSLLRTKTQYPFLSISAADVDGDGFDEALLSRLHYKDVYVVNFDKDIESADFGLSQAMSVDHVTQGLDEILRQIDTIKLMRKRTASSDEKLHVLWGMEATIAPTLFGSTIKAIDKKMRGMRCDNVDYAFMFTLKERGVAQYKRDGICAVGPL
ncbi:MAG: VCBS repeat-containing protein, partial [Planctomycetes bacterium]|nr:VCBS repeat-containing protein [Planctomycetota bacterium]